MLGTQIAVEVPKKARGRRERDMSGYLFVGRNCIWRATNDLIHKMPHSRRPLIPGAQMTQILMSQRTSNLISKRTRRCRPSLLLFLLLTRSNPIIDQSIGHRRRPKPNNLPVKYISPLYMPSLVFSSARLYVRSPVPLRTLEVLSARCVQLRRISNPIG